ncbi:MAG: cbb3-type cytochrome oxidase assembly protein CcoS [bacterium]|nr:cbb3-type cytochrome oxidase assembly protein CcoS [bacterium]
MSALYMLIGFSLAVALVFLVAFLWALRTNQYRDTCTPAMRMLFDEHTALQSDSGEEESP